MYEHNAVQDLTVQHGQIQSIKMGWDPVKSICKGFAFVTMASEVCLHIDPLCIRSNPQDDAKKAVELHGASHKGRLLKVELNDPNIANKKVARCVTGLSQSTRSDSASLAIRP